MGEVRLFGGRYQHSIGLVQDQVRDSSDVCHIGVHKINQAPRRGYQYLYALFQLSYLVVSGDPTIDRHSRDLALLGVPGALSLDLHRQLARR